VRLAAALLAGALLWSAPLAAHAWGSMGHAIVADIADRVLSSRAREEVRRLLGGRGMASVAMWADEIRKQRRETSRWHFVNIPREAAGYDAARDCARGQCIVAALERQLEILGDPSRGPRARTDALKFVIHLAADLHQPLHCIDDGDRGGNDVKVRWFGRKTDLHRVWDSDILAQARLSTAQQTARLRERVLEMPRRDALQLGSVRDWVDEAHGLAVDAYALPPGRQLGAEYYASVSDVVDLQLMRAGLRLARLLDDALGRDAVSSASSAPQVSPVARSCIPRDQCCKVCSAGQACGASCISRAYTCRVGRGCACDAAELCP
jgi:hypothetical protein